jgi:hypothetical protein
MSEEAKKANPEEVVIPCKWGAVGIAIRTAETADSFRALITIRYGRNPEKIEFNFGSPSGGVQAFGGDPGGGPPCP